MSYFKVLLALLAILPIVQIGRAHPIGSDGDETVCLGGLNQELEQLHLDDGVEKLVANLRSLNPSLNGQSLNKLLENKGAQLDLYGAGFIREGEDGPLVDACADYVSNVMEIMRATTCGRKLIDLSENDKVKFDESLDVNSGLDKVYGYARACLRLL